MTAKKIRNKSREVVVEALNKAREMELQAISQYMNHHYGLDAMDYGELAGKMKLVAIDEMRHAEMFAERIKELDGEPTADLAGGVTKGMSVETIYPFDTKLEDDTIAVYTGFLKTCMENGDTVSAKIFEQVIDEEQVHLNYFDNIAGHIEKLGNAYLARIAGTPSSTGAAAKGFVISNASA